MTDEQRGHIKAWVDALRSGEFEQVEGSLRDAELHCCLGVACEVYRREAGNGEWVGGAFHVAGEKQRHHLPKAVQKWLGIKGNSPAAESRFLTDMNDEGIEFPAIADAIEREWLVPA